MGSEAEPEAIAGRINYGSRHMTVSGLTAEYGVTDLDGSQPDAYGYLAEAETDNSADAADQR